MEVPILKSLRNPMLLICMAKLVGILYNIERSDSDFTLNVQGRLNMVLESTGGAARLSRCRRTAHASSAANQMVGTLKPHLCSPGTWTGNASGSQWIIPRSGWYSRHQGSRRSWGRIPSATALSLSRPGDGTRSWYVPPPTLEVERATMPPSCSMYSVSIVDYAGCPQECGGISYQKGWYERNHWL